jgi:hypothetical protein
VTCFLKKDSASWSKLNLNGRDHLVDLCIGLDGRIILKWFLEKWGVRMWSGFNSQDKEHWWALVNAVMNMSELCG